jgi:hypothetical protein
VNNAIAPTMHRAATAITTRRDRIESIFSLTADIVHGDFGFNRGTACLRCSLAVLAAANFARARAALLAAARLSGDHGV